MNDSLKTAMEIQAEMDAPSHPVYTYPISDFNAGVISKSAVVRHFQRLNPLLKVVTAGAFKIDHEKQCVTLELKTAKKIPDLGATDAPSTADADVIKGLQAENMALITKIETRNLQLQNQDVALIPLREENIKLKDRIKELEKVETMAQNLIDNKRPMPECKTTGEYFAWSEYWIKLQQALSADGE